MLRCRKKDEAATYSSACGSTIGAGELNGRVRDGNGCGLSAGATSSKGVERGGVLGVAACKIQMLVVRGLLRVCDGYI